MSEHKTMEELKPCPFIAVNKEFPHDLYYDDESGRIRCRCGASGPIGAFTKDTAIKAWNARHKSEFVRPSVEEMAKALEKFYVGVKLPPKMDVSVEPAFKQGFNAALDEVKRLNGIGCDK